MKSPKNINWLLLFLILLLAIFLRTWKSFEIWNYEELKHGAIANDIINFGVVEYYLAIPILGIHYGPLNYLLIIPFIYFLGKNIVALKLPFIISGVLSVVFLYFFTKQFYDEKVALLASLMLTIFPEHISLSTVPFQWIFNTLFVALTLYLFYKYSKTEKDKYLYLAAFASSLGVRVRTSFIFFLLPFCILAFVCKYSFIKTHLKKFTIAFLLFLLTGYPLIFLNFEGNISVLKMLFKDTFPITCGGEDLRDIKGNLLKGLMERFPCSLLEGHYRIFHPHQALNFFNLFVFATLTLISINLYKTFLNKKIYHKKEYFSKKLKKDIFILLCLFFTLIPTSTIAVSHFHVAEYIIVSPLIAIIIGRGINELLTISKKIHIGLFIIITLLFSYTIIFIAYSTYRDLSEKSIHPCTYNLEKLVSLIKSMNYSLVMADEDALFNAFKWYGLPVGEESTFYYIKGGIAITEFTKKLLQSPTNNSLFVFNSPQCQHFPQINYQQVFEEEIKKYNRSVIKKETMVFGDMNYTLYWI